VAISYSHAEVSIVTNSTQSRNVENKNSARPDRKLKRESRDGQRNSQIRPPHTPNRRVSNNSEYLSKRTDYIKNGTTEFDNKNRNSKPKLKKKLSRNQRILLRAFHNSTSGKNKTTSNINAIPSKNKESFKRNHIDRSKKQHQRLPQRQPQNQHQKQPQRQINAHRSNETFVRAVNLMQNIKTIENNSQSFAAQTMKSNESTQRVINHSPAPPKTHIKEQNLQLNANQSSVDPIQKPTQTIPTPKPTIIHQKPVKNIIRNQTHPKTAPDNKNSTFSTHQTAPAPHPANPQQLNATNKLASAQNTSYQRMNLNVRPTSPKIQKTVQNEQAAKKPTNGDGNSTAYHYYRCRLR